jgi:hypothetical protein
MHTFTSHAIHSGRGKPGHLPREAHEVIPVVIAKNKNDIGFFYRRNGSFSLLTSNQNKE